MVDSATVTPSGPPQPAAEACAHHWLIESPAGETSEGVCKLCGASRSFANYTTHSQPARSRRNQGSRAGEPQPAS